MTYQLLVFVHIVGVIVFLGVGMGSAFYKFMVDRTNNLQAIVEINKLVVLADWLFTTPAVIIQPLSGIFLAYTLHISLFEPWLLISLILYSLSVGLWLVAVSLQVKMKKISLTALKEGKELPLQYHKYTKQWVLLGIPSFFFMLIILVLMMFH